jgi:predicted DsbA family dithiol-disulfide isomerase
VPLLAPGLSQHRAAASARPIARRGDLLAYARQVGLDEARAREDLDRDELWQRVREDAASALAAGARGTPTLFLNGRLHRGGYDYGSLRATLDSPEAT